MYLVTPLVYSALAMHVGTYVSLPAVLLTVLLGMLN